MSCLLCNKPFGEDTITLDCGHTFDKVCLRQDILTKKASLDPCTCPVCLTPCPPYLSTILINVHIFNGRVQRERIYKIQDWVRKTAYDLDKKYGRKHPQNKYSSKPTKESMDEATLMGKQRIKQEEQQEKEEQEELIQQQQKENEVLMLQQKEDKALIQEQEELIQELILQQKENEVLMLQQKEDKILIQEQEELIQELLRERAQSQSQSQPKKRLVF